MNAHVTTAGQDFPGRLFGFAEKHVLTICISVLCVLLLTSDTLSGWFTWHRSDPLGLQIWLSHFSHWSGGHLFWDLLMFSIMACIIERFDRRLLVRLLVFAPPLIIASTFLLEDHLAYRGLSGLDCSLYAALVIMALRKSWVSPLSGILLLCLLVGKSAFEISTGSTLFVADLPAGTTAVPWAHLSGAITGMWIVWTRST